MTLFYTLYGLGLATDEPVPSLQATEPASPDITVHMSVAPPADMFADVTCPWSGPGYVLDWAGAGHRIWRNARGDLLRVRYSDGTEFLFDAFGSNIWVSWVAPLTQADAVTYLVGPIIGFVLRLRGRLCLHASCVTVDDRAFALTGSAGAGKSTTAAAFAQMGYAVLSDDITALEETGGDFIAQPGYPRLCLWPESATGLFGDAELLPRITPSWDKRHVDLARERGGFRAQPASLEVIYVLGVRSDGADSVSIEELAPAAGLVAALANTYGNTRLDPDMRAAEFSSLDRLVRRVSVRKVFAPASLDRITEFCERLLEDFHAVRAVGP